MGETPIGEPPTGERLRGEPREEGTSGGGCEGYRGAFGASTLVTFVGTVLPMLAGTLSVLCPAEIIDPAGFSFGFGLGFGFGADIAECDIGVMAAIHG